MKSIFLSFAVLSLLVSGLCYGKSGQEAKDSSVSSQVSVKEIKEKYNKIKEKCDYYDESFADSLDPSYSFTHKVWIKAHHNTPAGWISASALLPLLAVDITAYSIRIPLSITYFIEKNKECKKMKKYKQQLIELGQDPLFL